MEKQADVRDKFNKAFKNIRISIVVVSSDPLPPVPSTSSAVKTPKNTEGDPDDPEPADEGGSQMEYASDQLYSPSIRAVTKNYL